MTQNIPAISIADFLKCIRERLDKAAAITKQPKPAPRPATPKKVSPSCSIEQLVYEVNTFLNAASLLNRCAGN